MTPAQYKAALKRLDLTIVGAGRYFGFATRQAQRFASGEAPIPHLVEKVLRFLNDGKIKKEDLL